jgi:peptide-methionine (S)-S-oxide reductase
MFKPFISYAVPRAHPFRRLFRAIMMSMVLIMSTACERPGAHINSSAADPSASPHAGSSDGSSATDVAIFAGGCFWCTEADFDKIPGVISTTSGYIGGKEANPTYKQVSSGKTGHIEAVQVRFDPEKTSFAKLLAAFWPTIDPLTPNGQFCDEGSQYRSAIFYHNADQRRQAEASKAELEASGRFTQPVVTKILPATEFYPAEEYHQDYYKKNPVRYSYYRNGCGRDARLAQVWGIRK